MTTSPQVQIEPVKASGQGALDGFRITCSCGDVQTASLFTIAQHQGAAHLAYHTRKAAKR